MNKVHKIDFSELAEEAPSAPCYQKVMYKQIADAEKDIQNIIFSKADGKYRRFTKNLDEIKEKNIPKIYQIKTKESYRQDNPKGQEKKFNRDDLITFIDYYKEAAKNYWNWCSFNFKASSEYKTWKDFTKEVADQGYKISFANIPESKINQFVDEGSLFLFQIYNKDFASGSTGKPNLHTMYWKHLFSTENLSDIVLQLNGGAELFYRKASIKEPIVHKPGTKVVNRTTKDGKPIPEALHTEIYNYENGKSSTLSPEAKELRDNESAANPDFIKTVKHTLTKNKRYTTDKYLFHVPITINFKADNKINMNEKVLAYLKQTQDVNIIGLDRGERNLLYVSVINKKGEILAQKSFNTIEQSRGSTSGAASTTVHVDYHEKLDQKEKSRDMARKNWQTIGKIAELKEGYLSAVIHELAKMMLEYNAIIVLEDLNLGFKRTRFFREKQVYQKFEKMLLDKLNYLTLKDTPPREPGGILNGYQLTSKFESFEKLTKQSGFLFYIPASFTSKIDPKTGFVNMFNTRGLSNVQSKKKFFQKFESISYSGNNGFAFEFDYKNFSAKATAEMKQTKWTVYSRGKRIQFMGKSSASVDVEPTTELKTLFDANGIGFENGSDILSQILNIPADKAHASFFDTLYRMFSLVLQMRNSNAQTGEDFILSPVCAADGTFFDSRDYLNCKNPTMPTDADANGAYHIAKKGLLLLNRIAQTEDEKLKNMKLTISNAE